MLSFVIPSRQSHYTNGLFSLARPFLSIVYIFSSYRLIFIDNFIQLIYTRPIHIHTSEQLGNIGNVW